MDLKDKKEILDYLAKYKLMSLGTWGETPWAASVYFLFNDDLNFYFLSSPETRHCKNIALNPKVSITVADSAQKASAKKIGFQAWGVASKVSGVIELKDIIKAWNKRHLDTPPLNYKTVSKIWKSKFYKIELSEVQLFDENQMEDKEVRNWKLN